MRARPLSQKPLSLALVALGTAAVTAVSGLPATAGSFTGPSTVTPPYVLPVPSGVDITSLLTVNDSKAAGNGYEMVGIPDGLGAFTEGDSTIALMNHELRPDRGTVRRHGQAGAFVSKLTIAKDGTVTEGSDFINPGVKYWDYVTNSFAAAPVAPEDYVRSQASDHTAPFARFCSGFLSEPGQFLVGPGKDGNGEGQGRGNGKVGYDGQIYFANEESGNEGRVFGVTLDGQAYQLPRLGLFSWENTIAAPNTSRTTVVMGNEDATPGEIWVYVGEKTKSGSPIDKAGLTNGRNFVVKVQDLVANTDGTSGTNTDAGYRAKYGKGKPAPFSLQDIEWDQSGAAQNREAVKEDGLGLTRVEDGAFNPDNKNEYYFLTTEGGDKAKATASDPSRDGGGLWKLTFKDVEQPNLGGTLELVLGGTESWGPNELKLNKPDNMMIDAAGNLLIQEDPGGNEHLARILSYRLSDGARGVVARFDAARFSGANSANPEYLTTDEESSGIIQLADGSYVFDAQIHTAKGLESGDMRAAEYVENGQLLKMTVADFGTVYTVASNGTSLP